MHTKVWELIQKSYYITLITHLNPDGDTLGSALSFYPILKQMKKNVTIVSMTKEIPLKYDFLPNFKKIKHAMPDECDLLISFDCGSFDRLGIENGDFKIINIDHHKSNTNYGDINIIDTSKASATLVAWEVLKSKQAISKDEANCIYTGLVEDTGFFSHKNADSIAFKAASELIEIGAIPSEVSHNLKMRNSLAKTRLTALFINSIELLKDAEVGVGKITQEDLQESGAVLSDSDHLVDIIKNLATVKLAIFILENSVENYKISLRSKGEVDVSTIAVSFGGGGHQRASGFETSKADIVKQILNRTTI